MAEEEGVIDKSDVAMSTPLDHDVADSEDGALSDVISQHTENKSGIDIAAVSEGDIADETAVVEENIEEKVEDNIEENVEEKFEENIEEKVEEKIAEKVEEKIEEKKIFEIEPEEEEESGAEEKASESKKSETEEIDDNASKHSDGQLTTDNEEDEAMAIYNQNSQMFESNGSNFNQPMNAFNGNLDYAISQNLLMDGEALENRLQDVRDNILHLFNQLNMFNERLTDVENFDIDEFAATFYELSSFIAELSDIYREFDNLHDRLSIEALKCVDKYEENANIVGGNLLDAKMNKAKQVRNIINSWHRSTEVYESHLVEKMNTEEEPEPNQYYDKMHNYQVLSRDFRPATTGYTYVADIPPPTLPTSFFVAPTALPSFSGDNVHRNYTEESENDRTTELPTDLAQTHNAPPLVSNPPPQERSPARNSPLNFVPPMISQPSLSSFNTPPAMVASNILPPMNIPPPMMGLATPQNISSQPNLLLQSNLSTSEPKVILPPFQSKQQIPPKVAPVLIPGLNIANTAPLFAQNPSNLNSSLLSDTSLIPTQLPTGTPSAAGVNNFRKQNPQIAPLINLNLSGMGSKSPAQNPQSSSSSHIPSLLSIEVPFPIEILKRNQNQSQQQRFNNRNRRSPVVNNPESKESTPIVEKESQSVKSDEPMDTTEQQPVAEETPDNSINDTPDGVFVQPAIYLPIRSVNGYLTYYPHPVSSMTPPMGTTIPSYYASSPLTLMSNGAVSPIPNGSIGIGEGPAQMRKLFIGGLNHETTDDQLREYYSQWGAVVDCIVIRDPVTKQSRGFGFVTYATIQMAESAMNGRPHTINGKVVDPKRAIPREQMLPMTANNPPYFLEVEPQQDCKVILSGIHWDYHTVDGLRQHFETFGSVEQIEILGHPRGFGFVVFEDKESVSKCKAHGKQHSINGKKVEVKTDPSLDLPSAASVYSKRRHNLSGSQGYITQQHSSTATPDSICSTEYTSSDSIRSDNSETNNLQTTPTF